MTKSVENRSFLLKSASIASIMVAGFLLIIKIFAFEATGALSILAGLMDSLLDIAASVVNFFAVRYALNPADHEHRFGHGKAEALAGLMQATLITTSVVLLMIESGARLMQPQAIENTDIGVIVTLISLVMTGGLVWYQSYVIKKTGSLAIKADMLHYKTDFWLNGAILISLLVTLFSGILQIDSILSIGIALLILWGVKEIYAQSINQILDRELPDEARKKLYLLAVSHPKVHEIHDLRTRTSGSGVFMQFHMELPPETILLDAHHISDEVEDYIRQNYDDPIEVF
ncbi:MAG: ferrous-iron efflux pump FieF, partial [Alphaproteobacteria bacterium]